MWIWDLHEDLRAGRSLALVCSAALKIGRAKEGCRSPTAKALIDWVSVSLCVSLSLFFCDLVSLCSTYALYLYKGGVGWELIQMWK